MVYYLQIQFVWEFEPCTEKRRGFLGGNKCTFVIRQNKYFYQLFFGIDFMFYAAYFLAKSKSDENYKTLTRLVLSK